MGAVDDPAMMDLLVELSDTLVADLDADGLLQWVAQRCAQLVDAQAAGIMLADDRGVLRLLAAAPEHITQTRLFDGPSTPGSWCFASGRTLVDADLGRPDPRWREFALHARNAGFWSVAVVPMRIRSEIVGVLSVLRNRAGQYTDKDLRLIRALANMTTVGLLVQRDTEYREVLAVQSQQVLTGRVAIERARGVLAELLGVDVDDALEELRRHADRTGRSLRAAAVDVVNNLPRAGRWNGSDAVLLVMPVTTASLPMLRGQVRQRLQVAGLSGSALDSFLLAVHEATANAEEYGGGGRLWLWRHQGSVWCEISDDGPGLPAGFMVHEVTRPPENLQHVGLWLIHRICPDLVITSSPQGTRLLLRHALPAHPPGSSSPIDPGAAG